MSCCSDACEFHGDAKEEELGALEGENRTRIAKSFGIPRPDFEEMLEHYQPKGSTGIYKFQCRSCRLEHYNWDSC